MNLLTRKCWRSSEGGEDRMCCFNTRIQTHRRIHGLLSSGPVRAHFLCMLQWVPRACVRLHMPAVDVDGAAFSCHHAHSPSQWADRTPRDDTADPTISLSPAVNSSLARHGARIPPPWARCSLNTPRHACEEIIFRDDAPNRGAICRHDSPLIWHLSRVVFLIWKPIKSSSIHMCLTAEARLPEYAEHVRAAHERGCGATGHILI